MDIDVRYTSTDETRAPGILIGNLIPFIFATFFVAARLWVRGRLLKTWWWDDTFLVISWLIAFAICVIFCISTKYGIGHHVTDVPVTDLLTASKLTFVVLLFYQFALSFTKISVCLFYLRLFIDDLYRRLTIITITIIIIYTITFEVLAIFRCSPIQGAWDPIVGSAGTCIDDTIPFYTNVTCNLLVDVWLIVLIAPRIWMLKVPLRQKIVVVLVVTSGWLVIVAGIIRAILFQQFLTGVLDVTWLGYEFYIWPAVEVDMGLFCVSAPVIKPLVELWWPSLIRSGSESVGAEPEKALQSKKHTSQNVSTCT